jgi:hypothetical protein
VRLSSTLIVVQLTRIPIIGAGRGALSGDVWILRWEESAWGVLCVVLRRLVCGYGVCLATYHADQLITS